MITKGIVEEIIDTYTIKVRMPTLDGTEDSRDGIAKKDLSLATVSILPNSSNVVSIGDIVFIGFEDNDLGKPIILGHLYNKNGNKANIDLSIRMLKTNSNTILSKDTFIGDVNPFEIASLKDIKSNIQTQIENLKQKDKELETINTNVFVNGKKVNNWDADTKADLNGTKNIIINSNNPYLGLKLDNENEIGYLQAYNKSGDINAGKLGIGYGWDKSIKVDKSGNLEIPGNIKSKAIIFGSSANGVLNADGSITEKGQLLEDKYLTKIEAGKFGTANWSATQDSNGNLVFKYM